MNKIERVQGIPKIDSVDVERVVLGTINSSGDELALNANGKAGRDFELRAVNFKSEEEISIGQVSSATRNGKYG